MVFVVKLIDPGAAGIDGAAVRDGHLVESTVLEDKRNAARNIGILPVFSGVVFSFEQLVIAVIGVLDPPAGSDLIRRMQALGRKGYNLRGGYSHLKELSALADALHWQDTFFFSNRVIFC